MIRTRIAVPVVAIAILLAGCGGSDDGLSDLSAAELLDKTKAAFKAEESVAIKGEGSDEGSTIAIDMSYVGKDSEGSIAIDGNEMQVLAVDGKTYFKATDAFWESMAPDQAEQIIAVVNDRWILTNNEPDFKDLASFADRTAFADELLKPESTPKLGDPKKVAGVDCLALDDEGDVLYVAKDDGRPIQIAGEKGEGDDLNFTYDDAKAPEAPAKSEVLSTSVFGG